jgi:flavin reductase (DIM6/NTAB) family NADH-FMN oxidoreductase RutF
LAESFAQAESPADFESALNSVAAAVTLVTIADGRDDIGVTVSAFSPVSIRPPLISISLIEDSYPAELLSRLDQFAVTVLAASQRALAGRFAAAGRPGARLLLDDVPHRRGVVSGALIPDEGLLAMECQVTSRIPAGDHLLVIGLAQCVHLGNESGNPLIRFRGRYPALA